MSQRINQPSQSVRLTNVAVVRMNRGGKRFEIACYRNKVMNYRQGLETDLSEVLQTDRIFTNVSKGQFANSVLLQEVFGTTEQEEIAKLILQKGTLQVSDKERQDLHDSTLKEIANWIAANCVNPTSQRPYTTQQILAAIKQVEFRVNSNKSVKAQYLECVKLLQSTNPPVLQIERAKMELCLDCSSQQNHDEVLKELQQFESIQITSPPSDSSIVVLVDPSLYRKLSGVAKNHGARLEIKRQVVTQEGDVNLELELQRKQQQQQQEQQLGMEKLAIVEQDNDDEDYCNTNKSMRKNQKKQQMKSKKARRREQALLQRQQQEEQDGQQSSNTVPNSRNQQPQNSSSTKKSCNTCGGSFESNTQYRAHFRTDWHRYNVKLKMKGMAAVSEEEFQLCDADAFFSEETV